VESAPRAYKLKVSNAAPPISTMTGTSPFISALTRIAAALQPDHAMTLLLISGVAWIAAFLGFAIAYGPLLLKPRL
jgi:uncharacterized protein involved in response to NO